MGVQRRAHPNSEMQGRDAGRALGLTLHCPLPFFFCFFPPYGCYAGGFKLWECSVDLIEAVRKEMQDGHLSFRGKDVLELGCGHGLPGIFACVKVSTTSSTCGYRPMYGLGKPLGHALPQVWST